MCPGTTLVERVTHLTELVLGAVSLKRTWSETMPRAGGPIFRSSFFSFGAVKAISGFSFASISFYQEGPTVFLRIAEDVFHWLPNRTIPSFFGSSLGG